MTAFIIRRLLIAIPILLLVVTLVFFAFQLIPGDPAQMYVGEQATQETLDRVREELGLDRPVLVQFWSYLMRLARGDLGKSYITRRPVTVEVTSRYLNTVELAVAATLLATVVGITMGILSAVNEGGLGDAVFSSLALVGISTPVFWLGLLLAYVFSIKLHLLPVSGKDSWLHYVMPTVCLAVWSLAFIARMTRSCMLEYLKEDFVRTARSKGLPERAVLTVHVLRNALIPVTTTVGIRFGYMLGGAVVTETIFAWPGMGRLLVRAVQQRDIPVVQGVLLVFAASFVLVNLAVDVLYGILDPRIREGGR